MPEVTFTNHYKAGHSYQETWTDTEIHCPSCGKKAVWRDTSGGDYYVGEQHICIACAFSFCMPNCNHIDERDDNDMQRLLALRGAPPVEARRE